MLDLMDTNCHVPVHRQFRHVSVFQVGKQVFQFMVIPFRPSLAPRMFTKLTKYLAITYVDKGLDTLFYWNDWLLMLPSWLKVESFIWVAQDTAESMVFAFKIL